MDTELLHLRSKDGHPVIIDFATREIRMRVPHGRRLLTRTLRFPVHSEVSNIFAFVQDVGEDLPATTLAGALGSLQVFFAECGPDPLGPESFLSWLRRLRESEREEATQRSYAGAVIDFAEWLGGDGQLSPEAILSMRLARKREFKGYSERQNAKRLERGAITAEELKRLYRAIRLLMDEISTLLDEGDETKLAGYHPEFPLLPLPLLLGTEYAIRTKEYFHFQMDQIRDGIIQVKAPGKEVRRFLFDEHVPELREAWRIAHAWQMRYRSIWSPGQHPLYKLSRRSPGKRAGKLIAFTGRHFDRALAEFYRRYFEIPYTDGNPVLYQTVRDGGIEPFNLSWQHFRHASITHFARIEPDPHKVMKFAGHTKYTTAEAYYIRQRWEEWQANVTLGLELRSERMLMIYRFSMMTPEERVRARVIGAEVAVPTSDGRLHVIGGCGKAIYEGVKKCPFGLRDCRTCPFVRVDPELREVYIGMAESDLASADIRRAEGNFRAAEAAEAMAALSIAIVERIDEFVARSAA